jgi:hypothetical protein
LKDYGTPSSAQPSDAQLSVAQEEGFSVNSFPSLLVQDVQDVDDQTA